MVGLTTFKQRLHTLGICGSIILIAILPAHAQDSAFKYQGCLNEGGTPASGVYDLRFALVDAAEGGQLVRPAVTNAGVPVYNGRFNATLDFGPDAFDGSNYWIEIGVRTNGAEDFVALTPRQPVTPTPYALYAHSTRSAGLTGIISDDRLS
ncbi:MAG: hypothetical protein H7Y43_12140, partial [Akkermansiaceae bacterium]|nr:hypothetical protein [Verrucomicrobiales bacterium]